MRNLTHRQRTSQRAPREALEDYAGESLACTGKHRECEEPRAVAEQKCNEGRARIKRNELVVAVPAGTHGALMVGVRSRFLRIRSITYSTSEISLLKP